MIHSSPVALCVPVTHTHTHTCSLNTHCYEDSHSYHDDTMDRRHSVSVWLPFGPAEMDITVPYHAGLISRIPGSWACKWTPPVHKQKGDESHYVWFWDAIISRLTVKRLTVLRHCFWSASWICQNNPFAIRFPEYCSFFCFFVLSKSPPPPFQ